MSFVVGFCALWAAIFVYSISITNGGEFSIWPFVICVLIFFVYTFTPYARKKLRLESNAVKFYTLSLLVFIVGFMLSFGILFGWGWIYFHVIHPSPIDFNWPAL